MTRGRPGWDKDTHRGTHHPGVMLAAVIILAAIIWLAVILATRHLARYTG